MKASIGQLATITAMIAALAADSAWADENNISPVPVSTGMAFTFSHTFHGPPGLGVHVRILYRNTVVYNKILGPENIGYEPSNNLLFFKFPGGFPVPEMITAGNIAVYLAVAPFGEKNLPFPQGEGELAFVLEPHCPEVHRRQAPVCQYATAADWAIITPVKQP